MSAGMIAALNELGIEGITPLKADAFTLSFAIPADADFASPRRLTVSDATILHATHIRPSNPGRVTIYRYDSKDAAGLYFYSPSAALPKGLAAHYSEAVAEFCAQRGPYDGHLPVFGYVINERICLNSLFGTVEEIKKLHHSRDDIASIRPLGPLFYVATNESPETLPGLFFIFGHLNLKAAVENRVSAGSS